MTITVGSGCDQRSGRGPEARTTADPHGQNLAPEGGGGGYRERASRVSVRICSTSAWVTMYHAANFDSDWIGGAWGDRSCGIEQGRRTGFEVVKRDGPFEVRRYQAMIVAEYETSGSRLSAIREGFRAIANYLFGANDAREKIAMTAPVLQKPKGRLGANAWTVRFIMPSSLSMATLPRPASGLVALRSIPAQRFVVIRYSGLAGDASVQRELDRLVRYATDQKLKTQGEPVLAFYDPPWTLPFLRRNEIMLELEPQ